MQSGYNTNIRYRGVLFHVQSEDSGLAYPHIITHLYHGGTILASEKSGYGDHVDEPNLEEVVKTLMENQHKAVLKRLVAADYDHVITSRLGDDFLEAKATRPDPAGVTAPGQAEVTLPEVEVEAEAEAEVVAEPEPGSDEERAFGEGIVSEKPLDEVILGYLVENARKRKRQRQ